MKTLALILSTLVAALSFGQKNLYPDVGVVNRTAPFASALMGDHIDRMYSLHKSFDSTVIAIDKELTPMGWKRWIHYTYAHFQSPNGEVVRVNRERLVPTTLEKFNELYRYDPYDWVVILTFRKLQFAGDESTALAKLARKTRPLRPYATIAPIRNDVQSPWYVDVRKGTKNLEGNGRAIRGDGFDTYWGGLEGRYYLLFIDGGGSMRGRIRP